MKKPEKSQLQKELEAIDTVVAVTRLAVKDDKATNEVIEGLYTILKARLIAREALMISIRSETDEIIRERILNRTQSIIEDLSGLFIK